MRSYNKRSVCWEASLCASGQLDVKILAGNDKLTHLYTGLPTYNAFMALVEYLEPKARNMIAWNSSQTRELDSNGKQGGSRCFHSMSVANQLFSVVIRLWLGLLVADVCVHFGVSKGTYSCLFTTWICFLSKKLKLLFPFPTHRQINERVPRSFKKNFPNTRIIINCYEIECQRPSGLMNSSIMHSQYKS